ncbi:MAG: hypothetical protein COA95_01730 [Methylophaga sp.]|nr:MAG: hypothetical protein COA95_01730 [Methylophaga sp.]
MNKKTKITGAVLLSLSALLMAGTASAATAFTDPTTAVWGWDRGDTETSYAEWSVIADNAFDPSAPTGAFDADSSPEIGNNGFVLTDLVANNTGAFVTGTGLGGNVYSFSDTPDWTLDVETDYTLGAGTVDVYLQLKVLGTLLDFTSVTLDGLGYTTADVVYSGAAGGAFGGAEEEYLISWIGVEASSLYSLSWLALGSSMSLDEVSVDIGNYAATPIILPPSAVPVPAALFMFGPALLGFMGLRRKVANTVA